MAAQAQDARAEADRLESVSAEQREETGAARTDVEESLRKADRIDPDVRTRSTDDVDASPRRATADEDTSPRRATDEVSADEDVRDRSVRDDVGDGTVRDDVRDRTVRDDQASSTRRDVDDTSTRDDLRREDDQRDRVVDERSTDPRRST
jgi:hypothetical protein